VDKTIDEKIEEIRILLAKEFKETLSNMGFAEPEQLKLLSQLIPAVLPLLQELLMLQKVPSEMRARVAVERLYEMLRSLGYHPIKMEERRSEWRRSQYHLYTYPFGKRGIKISLHKDFWEKPVPIFTHKAENHGKDIERELELIQRRYGIQKVKFIKG